MQRRKVDFPDPEGPRIQSTSPSVTSSVMPLSTSVGPNRFRTSRAETTGEGAMGSSGDVTALRAPAFEWSLADGWQSFEKNAPGHAL